MIPMPKKTMLAYLGLVGTLLLIASCGGGGSGGSTGPGGAPTISRHRSVGASGVVFEFDPVTPAFTIPGPACRIGGLPAGEFSLHFDFVDAEGNVTGGRVQSVVTLNPSGATHTETWNVPDDVTMTGTTTGEIRTSNRCLRYGADASATFVISLFDAAGHQSNTLSTTRGRPDPRFPLEPRARRP